MPKINKIKLSGTSYDIQDSNASKTVTLTQAQYDALQTKDPNTFYIISDGETFDPSEKVDTSAFTTYSASVETALSGKAAQSDLNTLSGTVTGHTSDSTIHVTASDKATWNAKSDFSGSYNDLTNKLSAGTNVSIVDNVISAEGGGKAIEAGRGISVATGETADTVSISLPISAGTGTNSIIGGDPHNIASNTGSIALGGWYNSPYSYGLCNATSKGAVSLGGTASGEDSFAAAGNGTASGARSAAIATYNSVANGIESFATGRQTTANTFTSFAQGRFTKTTNEAEVALGEYNNSVSATTTFGNSGNTLFSVGNGTSNSARHNAFDIRQNGDIYIANTDDTSTTNWYQKPMVRLQDTITATAAHTADTTIHVTSSDKTTWSGKQDALVSGTNIKTINNESILGSGNITIQGGGGSSVVELTQAQYDALTTIDPDTIYVITDAAGGDLSNYYTKAQINAMIGDIESLLAAI